MRRVLFAQSTLPGEISAYLNNFVSDWKVFTSEFANSFGKIRQLDNVFEQDRLLLNKIRYASVNAYGSGKSSTIDYGIPCANYRKAI